MTTNWGSGPAVVYRCFAEGECLYVGATTDLTSRMVQHKSSTGWAWCVDDTQVTNHPSLRDARGMESVEILRLRPRWNIQGRGPRPTWKLADYAEVILAVHARREVERRDPRQPDQKINRLKNEMRKRYPDVAPLILADLEPHIPAASPERIAAYDEHRRLVGIRIEHMMAENRKRQEWVREQDRLDLLAEQKSVAS